MRAASRIGMAVAAMLALAPAPAVAQSAAATNSASPPATPPVVPDFTLNGTVTRREAPPTEPAAPAPAPRTQSAPPPAAAPRSTEPPPQPRAETTAPSRSVTVDLPPAEAQSTTAPPAAPEPEFTTQPDPAPTIIPPEANVPVERASLWPWLLAALIAATGIALVAWRRRSRSALARSGAALEAFVPAEPPPEQPAAAPLPGAAPSISGLVSSRLRPWLEVQVVPTRCVLDERMATLQFEVVVSNSGSAPARDVLVEACMFNAGPAQDQQIGGFFEHPVAKGNRVDAIPPLKTLGLNSAVTLPRDQISMFEVAGRQLFVPMLAFNVLYRWSGGEGQTSVSYLVGRDTQGEKLAPFRLDVGPRIFRGLGVREHHLRVRR